MKTLYLTRLTIKIKEASKNGDLYLQVSVLFNRLQSL